jgi:hypothetical protein
MTYKNPEKCREYQKKWRNEHPDYQKKYREKHRTTKYRYPEYYKEYFQRLDVKEKSREYQKNYRRSEKGKIKTKEYQRRYNQSEKGKIKLKEYQRKSNKKMMREFFEMYGNKCACCGETDYIFLTMDHVQNDGNKRRHGYGANNLTEYRIAIKEYRPDVYQILCYNCNHAKHLNGGACPHTYIKDRKII